MQDADTLKNELRTHQEASHAYAVCVLRQDATEEQTFEQSDAIDASTARILKLFADKDLQLASLQRERDEARAQEAPDIGEIERIRNVPHEKWEGPCRRCGKAVTLWFNGGELDSADCCGLTYRLTSERIDLVICDYASLRTEPA